MGDGCLVKSQSGREFCSKLTPYTHTHIRTQSAHKAHTKHTQCTHTMHTHNAHKHTTRTQSTHPIRVDSRVESRELRVESRASSVERRASSRVDSRKLSRSRVESSRQSTKVASCLAAAPADHGHVCITVFPYTVRYCSKGFSMGFYEHLTVTLRVCSCLCFHVSQ